MFKNEGGYSDEKYDKGGTTNFGITQFTLWRAKRRNLIPETIKTVKDLTISQAKLIYYVLFWQPNPALNIINDLIFKYLHFDSSVNHGIRQANKFLQIAIKQANHIYFDNNPHITFLIDGIFGKQSTIYYRYAIVEYKDELPLYALYLNQRYNFYNSIVQHNPKQIKFLHGWLNRLQQFAERQVQFC